MSENGGWSGDAVITCDENDCGFTTGSGKEAMRHSVETSHSLTGDGPFEGSVLTIRLVRDEDDEDWPEEPEGGYVASAPAVVCPECRDGKCGNCIGYALNAATDVVEDCACEHPEK